MTGAIAGYRATFKASSSAGGTKQRVSELQEISWSDKHEPFDATSHDGNGARERIGGVTDFEAAVEGLYADGNASQVALFEALNNRTKIDVQLVPAGSSATDAWSQSGFVRKWSIGGPVDGPARFSSSIIGTGGASALALFTLALDTFTDTDRNLSAHTPDSGFGGWTYSGDADEWTIASNRADKKNTSPAAVQFCRSDKDIADDNFEVYFDFFRSSDNQTERDGLYLLAHKSNDIALGEGVEVSLHRNSANPSIVNVRFIRRDSAGVIQQDVIVAPSISFVDMRLGATVDGLDVQVWTEPIGGGSRTNRGSAVTMTADLRDGDHRRIGMLAFSRSTPPASFDNLTVIPA